MNHAFEFTPMGIVPLGTNIGQADGAIAGAALPAPLTDEQRQAFGPLPSKTRAPLSYPSKPASPVKPVDVVKLARARLREVKRELSRMKKLETERDELTRLLDAAAHKPRATIRSLPTRSA